MKRLAVSSIVLLLTAIGTRPAGAAPIMGQQLFATGGEVRVVYLGANAAFKNDLYLFDPTDLTPLDLTDASGGLGKGAIFTSKESPFWATVNLGTFAKGQELVFGVYVRNTQQTYFLGPASRNPDGLAHGMVGGGGTGLYPFQGVASGQLGVGFEDIFGTESDRDFDDLVFAFSGLTTEVPEPATLALLALGAAAAGARRLRRRG